MRTPECTAYSWPSADVRSSDDVIAFRVHRVFHTFEWLYKTSHYLHHSAHPVNTYIGNGGDFIELAIQGEMQVFFPPLFVRFNPVQSNPSATRPRARAGIARAMRVHIVIKYQPPFSPWGVAGEILPSVMSSGRRRTSACWLLPLRARLLTSAMHLMALCCTCFHARCQST